MRESSNYISGVGRLPTSPSFSVFPLVSACILLRSRGRTYQGCIEFLYREEQGSIFILGPRSDFTKIVFHQEFNKKCKHLI